MNMLLSFFLLGFSLFSFAQTKEEHLEKQAEYNSKIKVHALKIKYGESRTQKEHLQNSEEIGKNLDSAVINHEKMKKAISRKHKDDVANNTNAIEKYHAEAKKHHHAMQTELSKPKHNETVVRHHATHVSTSVEKAEKEETSIKEKTKKKGE